MKTIVFNSNTLWSIVQFRLHIIKVLSQQYHIVCIGDNRYSEVQLEILTQLGVEVVLLPLDKKSINPIKELIYFFKLYKIYKRIKPDITIHYTIKPNIYGSLVSRVLNIKNIAVVTGLGSSYLQNNVITFLTKYLYTLAFAKARYIFFLNSEDRNYFLERKMVQINQVVMLPGEGVDTNLFPALRYSVDKEIVFVMVTRLLRDKGIYEYIEAIQNIADTIKAQFFLVGAYDFENPSAISEKEIQGWVAKGYITYLPPTKNILSIYEMADVIVLPSYREGLSRVLLEAMSCERFIITTNVVGCRELCDDEINGFLVEAYDANALAKAIEKAYMQGKESLYLMAKEGRKKVLKQYSSHIVCEMYDNIINDLLKKRF